MVEKLRNKHLTNFHLLKHKAYAISEIIKKLKSQKRPWIMLC
jgi:hypothetical protein